MWNPFSSGGSDNNYRGWDRDDLFNMTPTKFEQLVSDVMEDVGNCTTELTKDPRDGGVDVIATYTGLDSSGWSPLNVDKVVVQVKQHREAIPQSAIERMEGVRRRHEADQAWFVTSSYFSKPACKAGDALDIHLLSGSEFVEYLNESSLDPDYYAPI